MSSSEFQKRWQNEDYKNYLKVIEALIYLRDGLCLFSKHVISDFQSEILGKNKIARKECKTTTCVSKNVKNGKLVTECSNICSVLLKEILTEHKSCKRPNDVYWKNSEMRKWSVDAWEIAKIYMGRGQKVDNNGPQKSDSAAILQLLTNCKRFTKYTPCNEVDKVLKKRNEAMHSSSVSFTHKQMQDALTLMMDFLKKLLKKLSAEKDMDSIKKEIEKTIEKLKELMQTEFEIFLKNNKKSADEEETKIFQEIINDHENRLNSLEDLTEKVSEIKAVIPLLEMMQRNPDLMAKLEDGYQNLISLSQLEERTTALTEKTEATASRVTDIEEDMIDLRMKVEALTLKPSDQKRPQVTNHKGQLKNFLDSKRISVPARYKQWPDPTSNNKWLASVTVILGSETRTFQSPDSCQRIIDAEHGAASEAYKFLVEHEELFSASDNLMTGTQAKEELDKMLESFGFSKATYNDSNVKTTGGVKNFTASVTVNVTGIIQKKLDDVNMKQSDRYQAVALEALKAVGEQVAEKAKDFLYGWCGRNGTPPKYYPESSVQTMSYIHVISSAFKEKHKVEIEGDWHPSKKDAKRGAAESLLKIIRESKLIDIWNNSRQSAGDSNSTAATKLSQSSEAQCNEAKAEEQSNEAKAEAQCNEAKAEAQCNGAKAEVKALETSKAMPSMLETSPYCDELKSLCEKLGLNSPEYIFVTKENQFQANVTMEFFFGPDDGKQFKSKAEAENEAARIALEVLVKDKISETEKKKFKSLLNEFCQKQNTKSTKAPEYITKGSGTNFHSKVKVKFVESCSEVFETESEARNFSAKKILLKLGQGKNHFEILKKHCGLDDPKVEYKIRPDGPEAFRAVLDGMCRFVSETPSQSKKDVEKNVACRALKVLYPDSDCSDLNKCKNLLQEKTPSVLPKYDVEKSESGQFTGKVTVWFHMEGSSWHSNKEDALNEMAMTFLAKSTSSSN